MACRVALALSIASDSQEVLQQLARNHPSFGAMCRAHNILAGGPQVAAGGMQFQVQQQWQQQQFQGQQYQGQQKRQAQQNWNAADWDPSTYEPTSEPPPLALLTLDEGSNTVMAQAGLGNQAYAVAHSKECKEYFSNAHSILSEQVEDIKAQVTFHDDADWKTIPEVGAAIQAAGMEENGYCVAVAESLGAWGVGLASGWKARETAAKLALAVAISIQSGTDAQLAETYPEYARMLQAGGIHEVPALPDG